MKEIKIVVDREYTEPYRELLDYLKASGVIADVTYTEWIVSFIGDHGGFTLITIKYKEVSKDE